jgi:hypothetical protein
VTALDGDAAMRPFKEAVIMSAEIEILWRSDWESSAGVRGDLIGPPRDRRPAYVYVGAGEPHWRAQTCHEVMPAAPNAQDCSVIMACGCRATVPRWSLQPLAAV